MTNFGESMPGNIIPGDVEILGSGDITTYYRSITDSVSAVDDISISVTKNSVMEDIALVDDEISIEIWRGFRVNNLKLPKPHSVTIRHTEDGAIHETPTGTKTWDITSITKILEVQWDIANFDDPIWAQLMSLYDDHRVDDEPIHVIWDFAGFDYDCIMDVSPTSLKPASYNVGTTKIIFTQKLS